MTENSQEYDYWTKFATTFDDDNDFIIGKITNDLLKVWLTKQFKTDDAVLELGCGNGFCTRWIAPLVKSLIATDMSIKMIQEAETRLREFPNIEIRKVDCHSTCFEDGSFDAVLIANVIHVVNDPAGVLKESFRLLKTGGTLVVSSYTSYGLTLDEKKAMMRRYMSRWGTVPEFSIQANPEILAALAENSGFTVEESGLFGENSKVACIRARK
jgi:ubiquinone/menaquinone biosynthesis C-methylase UbiE